MNTNQLKDLSVYHQLVSDFFKWPTHKEEWEKYKLSDEQISFFKANGYVSDIKFLEEWQVDQLNEDLLRISDPNLPDHTLFHQFFSNEARISSPIKVAKSPVFEVLYVSFILYLSILEI